MSIPRTSFNHAIKLPKFEHSAQRNVSLQTISSQVIDTVRFGQTVLQQNILHRLTRIKSQLIEEGRTSGFHQFLLDEINFESLAEKIRAMHLEPLQKMHDRFSIMDNYQPCTTAREAFILNNYINFYDRVERREIELLTKEKHLKHVFGYVEEMGVTTNKNERMILFRNGNITKCRPGNGSLNIRKGNWQVKKEELTKNEILQLFLDQLIREQEETDAYHLNSIYIRCSRKAALKLTTGDFLTLGRTWFSFRELYSRRFVNRSRILGKQRKRTLNELERKGFIRQGLEGNYHWLRPPKISEIENPELKSMTRVWMSDPLNSVLLRVQLNKENYLQLLEKFRQEIDGYRLEGIHALKNTHHGSIIAKFEKNVPAVAIQDLRILGDFSVFAITYGLQDR